MAEIGDFIRIDYLNDEYVGNEYVGRTGYVTRKSKDPWGDIRLEGTWGGLAIYESAGDKITVLEEGENT